MPGPLMNLKIRTKGLIIALVPFATVCACLWCLLTISEAADDETLRSSLLSARQIVIVTGVVAALSSMAVLVFYLVAVSRRLARVENNARSLASKKIIIMRLLKELMRSQRSIKHGGTLGVDSKEGKGSTFFFKLPLPG